MKRVFCRNIVLLVLLVGFTGCAQPGKKTAIGAVSGSALGAGLGAIVGSATGDIGPGIAIGAGAGAVAGGLIGNSLDEGDQRMDAQRETLNRQQQQLDENRRLIEELRNRGADARMSKRGVVINLPDVLFQFDSATLTNEARRTASDIAEVLQDVEHRQISVEGHTDSIGTFRYNQDLSQRRARSVADALAGRGVASNRMSVRGYGEGSPIATNNSEAGRARNRRVEVIIEN